MTQRYAILSWRGVPIAHAITEGDARRFASQLPTARTERVLVRDEHDPARSLERVPDIVAPRRREARRWRRVDLTPSRSGDIDD